MCDSGLTTGSTSPVVVLAPVRPAVVLAEGQLLNSIVDPAILSGDLAGNLQVVKAWAQLASAVTKHRLGEPVMPSIRTRPSLCASPHFSEVANSTPSLCLAVFYATFFNAIKPDQTRSDQIRSDQQKISRSSKASSLTPTFLLLAAVRSTNTGAFMPAVMPVLVSELLPNRMNT